MSRTLTEVTQPTASSSSGGAQSNNGGAGSEPAGHGPVSPGAGVPGPRLPAAIQTVGLLARMVPLMERSRRRYGETFKLRVLGVGELVFISDPPSIKRLVTGASRLPRGRTVVLEPIMGARSILLLQGEEHLRRRRLMLPPFHGERMRAYEETIAEETEREIATWPLGETFELHARMQAITLEVILRAVFGVEDAARREDLRTLLVDLLGLTGSPSLQLLTLSPRAPSWVGPLRRLRELLERTDSLLAAEIAERRADPKLSERDDILSMLCAAEFEDGEQMDDTEIRDQLMTLLLAGHETTATALAWSLDLLFHNPAAFDALRESVAGGSSDYIDAVATETLRLRPVVPQIGRELTEPGEYGGRELPAGAVVMVSVYLAHTRPDVYSDPYGFSPERFLEGSPDTFSWIPFGGGTRRCLGAAFVTLEMRVVLRTLIKRTSLRAAYDRPEQMVRRNVTMAPKHGVPVVLESRS